MKTHFWKNLLIVIGVLAVFFVIVVSTAPRGRPKSSSAIVKASLANIGAQVQLVHDTTNPVSYQSVCNDEQVQKLLEGVKSNSISFKCFDDADSFVAAAAFKKPTENNTHYCVDSSGASKVIIATQYAAITNADTLCN